MSLYIEQVPATRETVDELATLLLPMHREMGLCEPDIPKSVVSGYNALVNGFVLVVRDVADRSLVGTAAMAPTTFWYSSEAVLQDLWFYIVPEDRGTEAAAMMLRAIRTEAELRGMKAFISPMNPNRSQKKTKISRLGETLGYLSVGERLRVQ